MQAFKVQHFERDKPGHSFPWFQSLGPAEAETIRDTLAQQAGCHGPVTPAALTRCLYEKTTRLEGVSAEMPTFALASVLQQAGIWPRPEVYINWYQYDQIDRIRLDDLARNFDDIWYPSSDDLDIFDDTFSWIVSITHEGTVGLLRFDK